MEPGNEVTIQFVADQGLCNGCGTCTAVCPAGSITVNESHNGLLVASVDTGTCTRCRLCVDVCSAIRVDPSVASATEDHFHGNVLQAVCGFATDERLRSNAKSGGVATAIVQYMIETGRADRALMAGIDNNPLRPGPVIIESVSDLTAAQSSWYCPVALNSVLDSIDNFDRLIFTGLSCHIRCL